jgi:hypothetical protein
MKTNVVGYIPRLMFKVYLYLKDRFDPRPKIRDEEKICIEITKKLINHTDSVLTLAPLSQKRFIKNDTQSMFIMIDNRIINIINHIYSYTLFIEDDGSYGEVLHLFDKKLDTLRLSIEDEFRTNIQSSLRTILDSIP